MPHAVAVIPARFASSRLPGKPLLAETGRPMVVHCADQAARAGAVRRVIVATDDPRIQRAVESAGHHAVMTRVDHPNGTCRIAEVADPRLGHLGADVDVIVNVQGDEPMIDPATIDRCVSALRDSGAPMATIASPFQPGEDPADPNIVKVVFDQRGRAMYFSRALIPHDRDRAGGGAAFKHVGLYAYRREFLPIYIALPPTPCENAEKLEQLRALEHGHAIAVAVADVPHHGIDTPEQYAAFVRLWRQAHRA
jgi:3-deoxy-manno-octulosonate cytidylyltransferase (CMP-KDO synthetase)